MVQGFCIILHTLRHPYQESDGGKWVRYDANGQMVKGWNTNENFDLITGARAHGTVEINGKTCHFDEATGILK